LARHVEGITLSAGAHAPIEWRLSFFKREYARSAQGKVLGWKPTKLKAALRKATARSLEALWTAIAQALPTYPARMFQLLRRRRL